MVEKSAFDIAVKSAIYASQLVLRYWPNPTNPFFDKNLVMKIFEKENGIGNYATIADKESEKLIIQQIQSNPLLQKHRIVAEESDEILSNSEYQWIIDPIDGTPPFRNGLPEFGISIGVLKKQEPIIGVIAMPACGQMIVAQKGNGAFVQTLTEEVLTELKNKQTDNQPLEKMLIGYDLGYEERGHQLITLISKLADKVGYLVSYGSSSIGNARVAQGFLGAYFCKSPTKFDIGAAAAIISEIGGLVTDMDGKAIDWNSNQRSYLAARNPETHQKLLKILQS